MYTTARRTHAHLSECVDSEAVRVQYKRGGGMPEVGMDEMTLLAGWARAGGQTLLAALRQ